MLVSPVPSMVTSIVVGSWQEWDFGLHEVIGWSQRSLHPEEQTNSTKASSARACVASPGRRPAGVSAGVRDLRWRRPRWLPPWPVEPRPARWQRLRAGCRARAGRARPGAPPAPPRRRGRGASGVQAGGGNGTAFGQDFRAPSIALGLVGEDRGLPHLGPGACDVLDPGTAYGPIPGGLSRAHAGQGPALRGVS